MKKVLFIDRDGTLIIEPKDDPQIDAFEKVSFYPKAIATMAQIAKLNAFELVMVSNQDGLGTDSFPEETFWPVQNFIVDTFKSEGVEFSEIVLDRTFASDNAPTRKPGTALLTKYMDTTVYDLENSFVIGDRITDVALAKNLGCKAIYINSGNELGVEEVTTYGDLNPTIALESTDWSKIYAFLTTGARRAQVIRTTKETDIKIDLDLNGVGKGTINTGISFFDHMLDQLSKHGQVDLSVDVKGDLEVDEHHTIEDTAIALGEAFAIALGSKLGIERYGFCLPMDDCLAQVAIDFGGRNWLEWEAEFKREMVGKMPTEMFFHFFKSFSDGAKANLNIKAEGVNEHHKIEAIFKAFAKAIKMAIKQDPDKMVLPSTKGML